MASEPIPLSSKPRFEILDGLRGVAAMIVVAFHLFETYSSGPSDQILNHGYLAVDFFFVLSGFVIGYLLYRLGKWRINLRHGGMLWCSLAVAYAAVKVYDIPVRAWLADKFIYNRRQS